jgi:hypothetical protein
LCPYARARGADRAAAARGERGRRFLFSEFRIIPESGRPLEPVLVRSAAMVAAPVELSRATGPSPTRWPQPQHGKGAEAALQRTPFRQGIREIDLVSEEEREKVYGMEIAEIKDSPGLTVDITFITSFHTRYVLDAIARRLPERPKFLDPIDENYLIWGNRPIHPFNKHFHLQRTTLSRQEQCAVCATRSMAHAV